jgi:hypothetical protein
MYPEEDVEQVVAGFPLNEKQKTPSPAHMRDVKKRDVLHRERGNIDDCFFCW